MNRCLEKQSRSFPAHVDVPAYRTPPSVQVPLGRGLYKCLQQRRDLVTIEALWLNAGFPSLLPRSLGVRAIDDDDFHPLFHYQVSSPPGSTKQVLLRGVLRKVS